MMELIGIVIIVVFMFSFMLGIVYKEEEGVDISGGDE